MTPRSKLRLSPPITPAVCSPLDRYEPQRPIGAFGDADAWGHRNIDWRLVFPLAHLQRSLRDIASVLRARNTHRQRQLAGAGRQILQLSRGGAAAEHGSDATERVEGSDQHAAGFAIGLRHQVQALVHAVDEVDVGVSGRTEYHLRAGSYASSRMSREIFAAEVGFGLNDYAGGAVVHQNLAEKVARYFLSRARVKLARQNIGLRFQLVDCARGSLHWKIRSSRMRLFTAIDLSPEVAGRLDALIAKLRPLARIRWSPAANLHITTKFVGQWPQERLPQLQAALAGMSRRTPIPIRISGLGFYPNQKSPKVFWAGVEAPAELGALARDTDSALAALGVEPESRVYSPHITLARIKEAVPALGLRLEAEQPDFGSFVADRFYLYLSKPGPSGSVYTKLSEFPFTIQ
jgi:2'-5' RNA ligase